MFTKSLDEVTSADVKDLIGWPESLTVEFKETLPGKDGRLDSWFKGGSVEAFARDKLFKEVVALANTSGGHLVLGVSEDGGAPPTAARIAPIPRCADLAERLARAAQQIDPPVPLLLVHGVATENDGAGVVVFRVPPSRSAPHRGLDKECYVRRGASSVPVGMREIQDMTLASGRRGERVDARFRVASEEFRTWVTRPMEGQDRSVGFRLTAVPVSTQLSLGRLYGRSDLVDSRQDYPVRVQGNSYKAHSIRPPQRSRPLVRGVRWSYDQDEEVNRLDIYSDGTVDFGLRIGPRPNVDHNLLLSVSWIIAYVTKVLLTVGRLRTFAGVVDCEYAIEMEIQSHSNSPVVEEVQVMGFQDYSFFDNKVGDPLWRLPLVLPRMSFGPMKELDQLVSSLLTDLYDAAGNMQQHPVSLQMDLG